MFCHGSAVKSADVQTARARLQNHQTAAQVLNQVQHINQFRISHLSKALPQLYTTRLLTSFCAHRHW